eukprot:CAMPEP_0204518460 /NCGR_PEP_ID=MMETSP0661-20131031/4208_1 /ASSEMBLY_ACC=CAM_ASM_000606 /TAXON_ID=109239 /ORGANISM="Alexandrium margalefi, Strain AMGDE01CS-322" /LENGTH=139 /DNA_ID=CAMNT_0051523905 /DNA_START=98 /DNA_END=517 /DNA_ORIENTATION=-
MALPKLSMKAAAPSKATRAMKAKRVSKVARGRFAKALVFRGRKEKTVGGVTKDGLMRNKRGRIVSKRASALGKRRYANIEDWTDAVMEARRSLHTQGFVAINGKTLHGKALYLKAKSLRQERRHGGSSSSSDLTARASE